MVKAMVMLKTPDDEVWTGLGEREFVVLPRKGDFVTMDNADGKGMACEVVEVHHPLDPVGTAGDIFLSFRGDLTDHICGLFDKC